MKAASPLRTFAEPRRSPRSPRALGCSSPGLLEGLADAVHGVLLLRQLRLLLLGPVLHALLREGRGGRGGGERGGGEERSSGGEGGGGRGGGKGRGGEGGGEDGERGVVGGGECIWLVPSCCKSHGGTA